MSVAHLEKVEQIGFVERLFKIAFCTFVGGIVFSIAGTLLLKIAPSTLDLFGPVYPHFMWL